MKKLIILLIFSSPLFSQTITKVVQGYVLFESTKSYRVGQRIKIYRLIEGVETEIGEIEIIKMAGNNIGCKVLSESEKYPIQLGDKILLDKPKIDLIIQEPEIFAEKDSIIKSESTKLENYYGYFENRKIPSLAFLWSSIIVGGGYFYTKDIEVGIFFLVGRISTLALTCYFYNIDKRGAGRISLLTMIALSILDPIGAYYNAKSFNNGLREKYHIGFYSKDNKFGLAYHF